MIIAFGEVVCFCVFESLFGVVITKMCPWIEVRVTVESVVLPGPAWTPAKSQSNNGCLANIFHSPATRKPQSYNQAAQVPSAASYSANEPSVPGSGGGRVDGDLKAQSTVCFLCNTTFSTQHNLKVHINTVHYKMYSYSCTVCGQGFNTRERFQDHMNMHNGIRSHRCQYCGRQFTFKTNLRQHISDGVCSRVTGSWSDFLALWRCFSNLRSH